MTQLYNPVNMVRNGVGDAVRTLIAGDTAPPDERYVRDSDDDGLFGPDSVTWQVHSDLSMLIGGVRALLLQTLHPLAMAGVADHSAYRTDPLGRLHRTGGFVGATTFGSTAEAEKAIRTVKRVHKRVKGTAPNGTEYSANDPHLLAWVHATEVDSFLEAYQRYGRGRLSPEDKDRYVAEMAVVAERLGAIDSPRTVGELRHELDSFRPELHVGSQAREAVRFLVLPPLPVAVLPSYGVALGAAVGLLPLWVRWRLRLPMGPLADPLLAQPSATVLLRTLGWVLGPPPTMADEGNTDVDHPDEEEDPDDG